MELLLNLLIFSLPFGVISRITLFANVSLYIHDVLTGLVFLVFLYKLVFKNEKIKEEPLFGAVLLFIFVALASLIVNAWNLNIPSFFVSFFYLLRFTAYSSLIFAFQFTSQNFRDSILRKLMLSGTIFTIFGFIQYFWYSNLGNLYYAGWDEHLYRLFSTMFDPNFAGVFLVLVFILVFSRFFHSKNKLIYGTLCLMSLFAIYLTYSRSAFISLIAGIVSFLIINRKSKVIVPTFIFLALLLLVFSNFNIEGLNPLRLASSEARIASAKEAIYIISKNPLFGVGFNAYRYAQVKYGLRDRVNTTLSNADAGTDNSMLFILATTGLVGFIAFLNIIRHFFSTIPKKVIRGNEILSSSILPSVIAWIISSMFVNSLFYTPILAFMYILIGVTVNKKR